MAQQFWVGDFEEFAHEGGLGGEGLDLCLGFDLAVIEDDDVVLWPEFIHEVGCPEDADAFFGEFVYVFYDGAAGGDVEPCGGFIEEEDLWLVDEGAGDFHASFVAAIEGAGFFIAAFIHVDQGEALGDAFLDGFACHAAKGCEIAHILGNAHIKLEGGLLEDDTDMFERLEGLVLDVMPCDVDVVFGGGQEACEEVEEGGFACAIGPQEAAKCSFGDIKAHIFEHFFGAIGEVEVFDAQGVICLFHEGNLYQFFVLW